MKIVCGSCSAKYSISDDKVQGKVFKIRCKKCSNVIVVKGGTVDEEVPKVSTGDWFVVIDGEQVGPITKDEIETYFLSGRIDAVTYTWRDGMPDWIHLSDIADFAHLSPATASPEAATNVVDASHYRANLKSAANDEEATISETASSLGLGGVSNPFSGGESSNENFNENVFGNDPFNTSPAADPFAAQPDPYGSNDLFNAAPAAEVNDPYTANDPYGTSDPYGADSYASTGSGDPYASESYDDPFTSGNDGGIDSMGSGGLFGAFDSTDDVTKQPQIHSSMGNSDMVGVRNENSVLFSLSSLDQIKAVNISTPNTMDTSNGVIGEGSGLIDIQALAAAHSSLSGGAAATPGMSMGAPVTSGQVDPFAHGTMAMPALMPMGSHKSNTTLYVIIGVVTFLLLGALSFTVYKITQDPTPQIVTKEVVKSESAGVTKEELMKLLAEAKNSGDSESTKEAENKIAALALVKAAEEEKKVEEKKEKKPPKNETASEKRKRLKAEKKEKERKAKIAEEKKKQRAEAKEAKKSRGGIDDLLKGIDGGKKKEVKKEVKKDVVKKSTGKQSLSRPDVKGTIRKYGGRVANCAKASNKKALKGSVKVTFYVKPNGRVTGAKVSGSFAGTDVGRCVQKVVAGMKFPKTEATKNQKISYPFSIR